MTECSRNQEHDSAFSISNLINNANFDGVLDSSKHTGDEVSMETVRFSGRIGIKKENNPWQILFQV